jgi:hypothetical protein
MESGDSVTVGLSELVKRYLVCWEVWPEHLFVNRQQRQVGFELELCGTHNSQGHQGGPCSGCRQVFKALYAIVEYILPPEGRASMYEIGPYTQALLYSAVRGNRPDVTLSMKVLHRQGFDQPVDACEERCLEEMKAKLKQLGACERHWSSVQAMGA